MKAVPSTSSAPATRSDSAQGPLAGVRILDMATVVAGPFAATLCARTWAPMS
ncbi:hypothetical protein ACTMU2_32830 [Cupriavidus basilensis]